ncbi:hypothetical protein M0R45_028441 [Rubus argutus]|uniref:WD repeat domain phosphoinositide-interacting protein 3 n=1 Tax=Rubus argutus TaxID=59490 RepID=A0AAW1W5C4_RUBAR
MSTISSPPFQFPVTHANKLHSKPDESSNPGPNPTTIFNLSFNQDHGCFAAGTDIGFRVYKCDPFGETFRREFCGRVGLVRMLNSSQIFAIVGGGPDPISPANKVMIWDDHKSSCFRDLSFRSEVRGVKLRNDQIVVVLLHKIIVHSFPGFKPLHEIETTENPKGLCEVSQNPPGGPLLLACPGLHKGQIRVENYGSKRTKFIMAHDSTLACFALTQDGRFLATASSKGTLVRVFTTSDGTLLQEVRRGADRAEIYSLAFSSTGQWLAVSSDKGTVHVFCVKVDSGSMENDRSRRGRSEVSVPNSSGISSLAFIKGVLPRYFSSEWSVAKFHLPEGLQHIVAFGQRKNTIMILGMDGSFYRCQFDPVNGGEMTQLEYHNFVKPEETF